MIEVDLRALGAYVQGHVKAANSFEESAAEMAMMATLDFLMPLIEKSEKRAVSEAELVIMEEYERSVDE